MQDRILGLGLYLDLSLKRMRGLRNNFPSCRYGSSTMYYDILGVGVHVGSGARDGQVA